ncbi:regulatory protein RecX [Mesonia aestuariivivens]|uniref:Regulatory protein RecX n=1 Tax=Mesonia aestuariivivens TaxID=2796128 RepID=A0ABS6VZS2_9FLAO|nr:regulatory protein RecX [Mesonia aestuariivivens]MBW2960359.1 RecX family transcriptional regulator [Mesonia aestuariivivens]
MNKKEKQTTYTVKEATLKMMKFCAYQERCHQEIEKKLTEMRMIPEARQQIIYTLIQENFLNEERFSQSFARGKFNQKKWGKIRIVRELKLRKISRFNIDTALKEIPEAAYFDTFEKLCTKKWENTKETNLLKKKKKVADYLFYRGWESNLVYERLRELAQEE